MCYQARTQFPRKKKHSDLEKNHDVLQQGHYILEERLDLITDAFGPATRQALLETAVYEAVSQKIPSTWHRQEQIKYGISVICRDAMMMLLCEPTEEMMRRKMKWRGPSLAGQYKRPLVLAGLAGLEEFITLEDEASLRTWDIELRNSLAHDGTFLGSLYPSLGDSVREQKQKYASTKEKITVLRTAYRDSAVRGNFPEDTGKAVTRLVNALKQKEILVSVDTEKCLLAELNDIVAVA